jgi:hypothetical protein
VSSRRFALTLRRAGVLKNGAGYLCKTREAVTVKTATVNGKRYAVTRPTDAEREEFQHILNNVYAEMVGPNGEIYDNETWKVFRLMQEKTLRHLRPACDISELEQDRAAWKRLVNGVWYNRRPLGRAENAAVTAEAEQDPEYVAWKERLTREMYRRNKSKGRDGENDNGA